MTDDTGSLRRVVSAYDQVWQDLDVEAILAHYHYPCMVLTPEGVAIRNDAEQLRPAITGAVAAMEASEYSHSEIAEVSCKQLSDALALVSQYAVRFDAAGDPIGEGVTTYTFSKTDGEWKIAVLMPQRPIH